MADAAPPLDLKPLYWLIAIIIFLFLVWLFTGGPQKYEEAHPEIIPPAPAEVGIPTGATTSP